ncbi:CPBP family intramembrane metalloprotease [Skermania sp. ID1734]|nr:CPBP family intramembrane metalloprotease [Skermania sp. ID1734]
MRVGAAVAYVAALNLLAFATSAPIHVYVVPVGALVLVFAGHLTGLSWRDMAIGWSARGAAYALTAAAVVAIGVAAALALPPLREFLHNDRYDNLGAALLSAFVIIPVATVLPEELIFRGVLLGSWLRAASPAWSIACSAVVFGLWHVTSSLGLAAGNAGLSAQLGSGRTGQILGVLGAVAATTVAGAVFGWLRWHARSLLPSVVLHWALNGFGAIGSALATG